ncbi:unnamed protein product [Pedinophyceae sp. YPF-701]|nr:unnamed protein product [Pedinophyceae sp. YPF-701]
MSVCTCPFGRIAAAGASFIGAGLAGLATTWHLVDVASKRGLNAVTVDLYDAKGIGAGASGAAAGLLHAYGPRGKVLWRGPEAFDAARTLLRAAGAHGEDPVRARHGLVRPASGRRNAEQLWRNLGVPVDGGDGVGEARAARCVSLEQLAALMPSGGATVGAALRLPAPTCAEEVGGLLVPDGLVVSPQVYMAGLWEACVALAGGAGAAVRLVEAEVGSVAEMGGEYDAVVVAAGAAMGSVAEARGAFPLRFCQGFSIELAGAGRAGAGREYPGGSPSVLGSYYVAEHDRDRVVVGATKDNDATAADAGPEAAAVGVLRGKAEGIWSDLADWDVALLRSGVRALSPKTHLGTLPMAGRVGQVAGGTEVWAVTGLGARGFLYHAILGKWLAQAVLDRDPGALPEELRVWQGRGATHEGALAKR